MTSLHIAENILLSPTNLRFSDLENALKKLLHTNVSHADLYFQYSRQEHWGLEEGQVKTSQFNIEQGFGARAVSGERTAFAYSDDLSSAALSSAVSASQSMQKLGLNQQGKIFEKTRISSHELYQTMDPIAQTKSQTKVNLLLSLENKAKSMDPRISQVTAGITAEYKVILLANQEGFFADIRPLVRLNLRVIAEENGRKEQGTSGGGGRFDYAYFTEDILTQYAEQAVHQALTNLRAKPAPAGNMTVVLGAGWPGILLHEAIGHGLEGDFNRKESSAFSHRMGQRVASKGITVVDDGTISQRRGSLNIDDEGNPTQRTVLIEDGILCGYLQDGLNANLMKMPITGNGRRESYAHLPLPRMTNTFMLNGTHSPDEIIASVKNGIYAVNFSGGQVDITSGKFVFSAAEAYLIENGKITTPVKGATLIGDGPEVLNRVSMIGNDMRLDEGVGTCGKEGQSVPVGVGQPTLKIDNITVGGTG